MLIMLLCNISYLDPNAKVRPNMASFPFTPERTYAGGTGNDTKNAGTGTNASLLEVKRDLMVGNAGNDFLRAGGGDDYVLGGKGNDTLQGMRDNDIVMGGEGDDTVTGGQGNDIVAGDYGTDTLYGENSTEFGFVDRFLFQEDSAGYVSKGVLGGIDTIKDFEAGIDVIDLTRFDNSANFSFAQVEGNVVISYTDYVIAVVENATVAGVTSSVEYGALEA